MHWENRRSLGNVAKEWVVVENNSLQTKVIKSAVGEAFELCAANPNCRNGLTALGATQNLLLTNKQIEEATEAGISRDPAKIAKLSPDQIVWLDSQIIDGVGMASEMFGRQTWGNRLSPLDNSAPAHTGGDQLPVELPRHTGNNSGQVNTGPNHTGNEENVPGVGPYNTGNTEGKPNTGSNITVTPIPDAPNKDDLAYLAKSKQSYQPNQGGVGNMGEFFGQAGFGSEMKGSSQKTTQIYQGQSVYQASGKVGEYIKKGDKYYLDGSHKNHLEVFDKRGNFRVVLNLDGSINETKTKEAEGRKLK